MRIIFYMCYPVARTKRDESSYGIGDQLYSSGIKGAEMIVFSKEQIKQLKNHAKTELPNEACGILTGVIGGEKVVKKIYPCKNVDSKPQVGYRVDAGDQLRVFEEIEKSGYTLIGFYHSHPTGLNTPSMIDVEQAEWPDYSYLIITLSAGVKIGSWIWTDEKRRFVKEEVKVKT